MQELIRILEEMHPDIDFATADHLVDNKVLDSFDIITIITEISQEFSVVFPAEEITPENFNSVAALWNLIERLENE